MPLREIIEIDEEKCDGCGLCIPNCAEGALEIIDGKACIVRDELCDGLGACLGHCPQGALRVIKREAPAFDETAVEEHLAHTRSVDSPTPSCSDVQVVDTRQAAPSAATSDTPSPSALRHWPVALRLVPVKAPFFQNADLLITADCVPFAYGNFHNDFLDGKVVVFGCPKFDDAQGYVEKLGEILRVNPIKSITLVNMEVPCCFGLQRIVEAALMKSGQKIPLNHVILTTRGEKR